MQPRGKCVSGGVARECKRGESCPRCLANANSRRRQMVFVSLTASVSDTTMAIVKEGAALGSKAA